MRWAKKHAHCRAGNRKSVENRRENGENAMRFCEAAQQIRPV
ncbi:hypothetical protein BN1221_01432 [Brenneria goodwinii]|uniref:Uncharacterized protein n=1 Tax=Brenneria goodwinii TaxID=1109412 RepID=A0A0G4JST8_9GAMM|nr:hypothetical protein BN1221_01432 [Brenneria goodwinii]